MKRSQAEQQAYDAGFRNGAWIAVVCTLFAVALLIGAVLTVLQ